MAIGPLYGHFPTRHVLVGALLRERHDALFAFGEQVSVSPDVGAALRAWVRAVVEHAATYRGLAEVVVAGTAMRGRRCTLTACAMPAPTGPTRNSSVSR